MSSGIDKEVDLIYSTEGSEWHKFATPSDIITAEQVKRLCPTIIENPLFAQVPELGQVINPLTESFEGEEVPTGRFISVPIPSHKVMLADYRLCRPEMVAVNGGVVPLHVPKNSYRPIGNWEVWEMLQDVLKEIGGEVTTAGTLEAGKKIFYSVKMDGGEMSVRRRHGIDKVRAILNFVSSHDGTIALNVFDCMIRIVCMNTLRWAMEAKGDIGGVVYHSGNASDKIKGLIASITGVLSHRAGFAQAMAELDEMGANVEQLRHIPLGYFATLGTDECDNLSTRSRNAAEEITRLAIKGMGNNGETMYDLGNGATEYWTSGEGCGKKASAQDRLYKAQFAGAADHKVRFIQGLLDADTRAEWQEKGKEMAMSN
jgi:hypothetical protein